MSNDMKRLVTFPVILYISTPFISNTDIISPVALKMAKTLEF